MPWSGQLLEFLEETVASEILSITVSYFVGAVASEAMWGSHFGDKGSPASALAAHKCDLFGACAAKMGFVLVHATQNINLLVPATQVCNLAGAYAFVLAPVAGNLSH
jgi:hypothetical protein